MNSISSLSPEKDTEQPNLTADINITGNISYPSLFVSNNTFIIFSNWGDNFKIYKSKLDNINSLTDFSKADNILEYNSNSLTNFNNDIYFSNSTDNDSLYKMTFEDTTATKINNDSAESLIAQTD